METMPAGPRRPDPAPRLERIERVRVHAIARVDLVDPVELFYGLAIAAGAIAGIVVSTFRLA
ncbi:MAG TPA: hypothetical protein VFS32_15290 [Candidatus Limnocylindrales bacterium]|nr:hypothetical protein [Candidatus Limnocylindrales bacterium]